MNLSKALLFSIICTTMLCLPFVLSEILRSNMPLKRANRLLKIKKCSRFLPLLGIVIILFTAFAPNKYSIKETLEYPIPESLWKIDDTYYAYVWEPATHYSYIELKDVFVGGERNLIHKTKLELSYDIPVLTSIYNWLYEDEDYYIGEFNSLTTIIKEYSNK